MAERNLVYFVADVHLGLRVGDPSERESRFVSFLRSLPVAETKAVCLLGDIWDFWYEYRDVIPKEGVRVVAALIDLMDAGVEVYFIPGNHDIWTYSFFREIGIRKVAQPYLTQIGGVRFCLGHGDCLGGSPLSYRVMLWVFRNRFLQRMFSILHPTLAYRFGTDWSKGNRKKHSPYVWKGTEEPLWKYSAAAEKEGKADCFIFGHYHVSADEALPRGGRLVVLKDWIGGGAPHAVFDGRDLSVISF